MRERGRERERSASAKLNNRMAVGASQVLAWLAVPHLGLPTQWRPDEIHLR